MIFEELGRLYFPQGDRNEEGQQRNHEDGKDGLESRAEPENDGGQKVDHGNKPDGQKGREEWKN